MSEMRPFASYDLPGIYRVCAEVDARGSGEPQFLHAPDLAGHVFAGPYIDRDPALCWVVTDDLGVAGYLLATEDAARFEAWREAEWFPALRQRHPARAARSDGSADDRYLRFLHAPPRAPQTYPAGYPAELHVKLAPRIAGRGWGRRLMEALLSELGRRGVPGVHLGVAAENANAIGFYTRLGFRRWEAGPGLIMLRDVT